jgi:hypothetical protein
MLYRRRGVSYYRTPFQMSEHHKQTSKETPMGTIFILGFVGLIIAFALAPDPEQQKRKKRRQSNSKRRYPYA